VIAVESAAKKQMAEASSSSDVLAHSNDSRSMSPSHFSSHLSGVPIDFTSL